MRGVPLSDLTTQSTPRFGNPLGGSLLGPPPHLASPSLFLCLLKRKQPEVAALDEAPTVEGVESGGSRWWELPLPCQGAATKSAD